MGWGRWRYILGGWWWEDIFMDRWGWVEVYFGWVGVDEYFVWVSGGGWRYILGGWDHSF